MADRSKCDLPYGHYGRIEYVPDDQKLSFGRRIQSPTVVTLLDESKIIENPPHAHQFVGKPGDGEPKGKRRARQIKVLVEAFPEFEPAAELLPDLLQVAEAAEDAQDCHDPFAGSIVAFAKIRSEIRHRAVTVVAMRTGTTGCVLRVAQLEMQRQGWAEDKNTWLEMPILGDDQAIWESSAGAIQQLLFAEENERRDSLLAVRMTSKVIVFKITIGKGTAKSGTSFGLKLDMVFQTQDHLAPGCCYMDVAFNPWFSQQIAILNSFGHWQVLEVSSRGARHFSVTCRGTSRIDSQSTFISDGWARIAWVVDMGTLSVCTRQQLTVYSIRESEPVILKEVPMQLAGAVPWILDFIRLPSDLQRLAVLTSTHLLLYRVTRTESEGSHVISELKLNHYQNTQDLSLRITSFANNRDLTLGLYSSMHDVLTMHQLFRGSNGRIASADPYYFTKPLSTISKSSAKSIRDLCIRPIPLCHKHEDKRSDGRDQSSNATQYHTLTVFRRNGMVEQSLLCIQHNPDRSSLAKIPTVPSWTSKAVLRTTKLSSIDAMVDDSALQHSGDGAQHAEPVAVRARRRGQDDLKQQNFLDLEALADALNQSATPDRTVENAVTEIERLTSQTASKSKPLTGTLDRLLADELVVNEVERASAELTSLFSKFAGGREEDAGETIPHLRLDSVDLPPPTQLSHEPEISTLSSAYERIVSSWISALPSHIAGRIRLAKREIGCRVAAELILASRRLRPTVELDDRISQLSGKESNDPVETWDLPVRATRTGLQSIPTSSPIPRPTTQPSSLPTPSPTATPSITTASSRISTAAPQLDRLAAYTSFNKPTPLVLPRSLSNVLSHWEVGSDPSEYDWMSQSRHVSQVDDDETQGLTEKERQRAQRQAERHLRRQRKEAAASQASQLASSQAVDIISTSQHSLLNSGSQRIKASKSSQTESQSQSRHGGRPPKKKRKEGF